MEAAIKRVSVSELLEFTDKSLNEGSSIQFCQNFINEVMDGSEGVPAFKHSAIPPSQNGKDDEKEGESGDGAESGADGSKIREDGFLLFKNLCKLSMKFSSPDHPDDQILLRGKILSLELLKVVMDNGGPIWRSDERLVFHSIICLPSFNRLMGNSRVDGTC